MATAGPVASTRVPTPYGQIAPPRRSTCPSTPLRSSAPRGRPLETRPRRRLAQRLLARTRPSPAPLAAQRTQRAAAAATRPSRPRPHPHACGPSRRSRTHRATVGSRSAHSPSCRARSPARSPPAAPPPRPEATPTAPLSAIRTPLTTTASGVPREPPPLATRSGWTSGPANPLDGLSRRERRALHEQHEAATRHAAKTARDQQRAAAKEPERIGHRDVRIIAPDPYSGALHALLLHLEKVGFTGAPRSFGWDDKGRHLVEFVPGTQGGSPRRPRGGARALPPRRVPARDARRSRKLRAARLRALVRRDPLARQGPHRSPRHRALEHRAACGRLPRRDRLGRRRTRHAPVGPRVCVPLLRAAVPCRRRHRRAQASACADLWTATASTTRSAKNWSPCSRCVRSGCTSTWTRCGPRADRRGSSCGRRASARCGSPMPSGFATTPTRGAGRSLG